MSSSYWSFVQGCIRLLTSHNLPDFTRIFRDTTLGCHSTNTFRQNYITLFPLHVFFLVYSHISWCTRQYTNDIRILDICGESKERYKVMTCKTTINRTTKFVLILFGIWPGISCITLCRIFWTVTIVIVLLCHYLYFLTHYHSVDVFDLMDCFSSFIGYLKLMIKVIFFWLNQR